MSNKTFFDEETVEKVIEHDKEEYAKNKKKGSFNRIKTAGDSYNKYSYENEALLKAYVGKNYKKIMSGSFNWSAFFFGSAYLLYRKMFTYGFLLSLFTSILSSYALQVNTFGSLLAYDVAILIVNIVVGTTFNRFYIGTSVNDIMRLKKNYPTMDTEELCRKKGGTSILFAIGASFIIFFLVNIIVRYI